MIDVANQEIQRKQAYYIAVGEIVFHDAGVDYVQKITANALVIHNEDNINLNQIGRIQQALQLQFFQKMQNNPNKPEVIDVIIQNLIFLGNMTPDEFKAGPDGTVLQEQLESALKGSDNEA